MDGHVGDHGSCRVDPLLSCQHIRSGLGIEMTPSGALPSLRSPRPRAHFAKSQSLLGAT